MSDFSKKSSFAQNLANAIRYLNYSDNEAFGWQLPCTVAGIDKTKGIVTVNFSVIGADGNPLDLPQTTIPIMGWKYIRYPIKKGDVGATISCDTNTQNISRLSPGVTTLIGHGNLGPTLFFVPLAQADWSESDDADAIVAAAPNGAILRTDNGDGNITINKDNIIVKYKGAQITLADGKVIIDSDVEIKGNITVVGTSELQGPTTIEQHPFLIHQHVGVTPGPGITGGVFP